MSELLEHLSKYIGTESEPIVYSIDKGAIKFFADSLMNPDPLYCDDDYARTTKHEGIIAPPTFYGGATSLRNVKAGDARTVSSINIPMPLGWVGMNAGDDFHLLAPIRPGDTLTSHEKLIDAYEREGRSGHLIFVVVEKTLTNQHGQVTLVRRVTSVFRATKPKEGHH